MIDGFLVNPNDFIQNKSFGSSLKNGLEWLGRKIKLGFEKLSPYLKTGARLALNFLKTPLGLTLLGATVSAILLAVANSDSMQGDLNQTARVTLKIISVVLFVAVVGGLVFTAMHGNAPLL